MNRVELLVLGSGGPFVNRWRTSSAYLLMIDGDPRVLVDAGGGVFERLGRAGIAPADLGTVLLTHTHIDHTGGLAPVVFSAFMEGRQDPLTIVGPAAGNDQPGCRRFVELLFGREGAWSYLHSFAGFGIDAHEVPSDPSRDAQVTVIDDGIVQVRAVAVPHGMMPALAYRIDLGGVAVVFSGDVQEFHQSLVELAAGCDTLICNLALPEREVEHSHLHAKPSQVGKMAEESGARQLVLTHFMPEIEDELPDAVDEVCSRYHGELILAEDLLRVPVPPRRTFQR
jgi:ribonuclease BN (tRNA processing enzyme)